MNTRRCPYCGETINSNAIKCKNCGEWLYVNSQNVIIIEDEQKTKTSGGHFSNVLKVLVFVLMCFFAHMTIPDKQKHNEKLKKDSAQVVMKHSRNLANRILPGVGSLAYLTLDSSDAMKEGISSQLKKKNKYSYHKCWFWSTCEIQNRIHPEGKIASFGMFGIVVSLLTWDDIAILD